MIDLIPARPEMARVFRVQEAQQLLGQVPTEEKLAVHIDNGLAMAVVSGSRILAVGGILDVWENYGKAWGLLADDLNGNMAPIHRIVERVLTVSPLRRIEAQVAVDHRAGQRWVRMLGFQHEGRMRAFFNDQDYDLFARVK